jgi:hypothetical protein
MTIIPIIIVLILLCSLTYLLKLEKERRESLKRMTAARLKFSEALRKSSEEMEVLIEKFRKNRVITNER